ncbi:MAG: hypothetical protein CMK59_15440 [Proteobacteria bacterium]|nr:hypothetical protein [Pseudomonadota bacterium]
MSHSLSDVHLRKETRYFICKYGRVLFFRAKSLLDEQRSSNDLLQEDKHHQIMNICSFSAEDAIRFTGLFPLGSNSSLNNKKDMRSLH